MIDQLKALGRDPRFHGNGFTQLYLNEFQRLHIWHPQLPPIRDHNATVHDHIWDMQSDVLMGTLINREFDVRQHTDGEWQMYLINQRAVRANEPPFYTAFGTNARLKERKMQRFSVGSSYTFPAMEFHSSDAEGITATLMTKGPDLFHSPRIVVPIGEPPINAFDPEKVPHVNTLWTVIEDVIKFMPFEGQRKLRSVFENQPFNQTTERTI